METGVIRQGLREITAEEVHHIQKVVEQFPGLSRKELAQTLCEHLRWYSPSGANKVKNCLMLLERLAVQGMIVLPKKSARGRKNPDKRPTLTPRTAERPLIKGSLKAFAPILLQTVNDKAQVALWNEYVERYHPLGMTRGEGISRPGKRYTTSPKCIYVKSLDQQFRALLCCEQLQGRIIE